jgi:hypothetical protein
MKSENTASTIEKKTSPKSSESVRFRPINNVVHEDSAHLMVQRYKQNLDERILPGVEAIGAGYDIFGYYASAKSIRVQIFDWRKSNLKSVSFMPDYFVPEIVDVQQQDAYQYDNSFGNDVSSFQQDFSSKVSISGSYNLFSASISNEFTSHSLRVAENEFSRIQQNMTKWSLALHLDYDSLRGLLHGYVNDAINSVRDDNDCKEVFQKYGTHFLSGIIMGGKATFSSATNKVRVEKSFSNETIAKAAYESATGQLSSEAKAKYEESIKSFQMNSDTDKNVVGGDSSLAMHVFSGSKEYLEKWAASVADSPDFVDYMPNNALTGIWELCLNSTSKYKLKSYYERKWAPEHSKAAELQADYIDSLKVIYGDNSGIKAPSGYTKIDVDLNEDAGGDYIYLCTHKTTPNPLHPQGNKKCITNIRFVTGEGADAPSGYEKINIDLNRDAGGEYIYLCYKLEDYDAEKAIKDITIVKGGNPDVSAPYDYHKVDKDLNEDAGGDYVYLCYSKKA